eukprot:762091-Rhodomonas_salina.4
MWKQLSWDIALDNHCEEELGELVFDTLLEIAPSFKNLIGSFPLFASPAAYPVRMSVSRASAKGRSPTS